MSPETPTLIERPDGSIIADARMPIEALEEQHGIGLRPDGRRGDGRYARRPRLHAGRAGAEARRDHRPSRRHRIRGARRRSAAGQAAARARAAAGCAAARGRPVRGARASAAARPTPAPGWRRRCAGWRRNSPALTGWRRYGLGVPARRAARRRVAAGRYDAADLGRLSGAAVARRGQRRGLGVGAARLCLRARLLRRRPLLDRGGAVRRYRPVLVGLAVRGARPAGAFWRCFPAAALGSSRLATRRLRLSPAARVCLFAVLWSAAEWLRGHVLTGFPWNLVGYVWSGGFPGALAMLQSTAWVGIYGLSFVTVLAASLPALLGGTSLLPMPPARRAAPAVAAALLILVPAPPARSGSGCCRRARPIPGCASCSPRSRRGSNGTPAPPRPISAA